MPTEIRIQPKGAFALAEAARFWKGFVPGTGTAEGTDEGELRVVFRQDGDFAPAGAVLRQGSDGAVLGRVVAGEPAVVQRQVARMLSLDVDGAPFDAVLSRDARLAKVHARWPGFRPVCFASPWEAAFWGVIVQGIGMNRAATLKRTIAEAHGDRVTFDTTTSLAVIPSPRRVLDREIPELDAERLRRLRAAAEAAVSGSLDAERLRALPIAKALAELRSIRGIGGWTSTHILYRGAALADAEPFAEPRVQRGLALAYGLRSAPNEARCAEIARAWIPYRMWGAILVVRALAGTKQWRDPAGTRRR
jgi:DNA-3-methyladenine glycosylase II